MKAKIFSAIICLFLINSLTYDVSANDLAPTSIKVYPENIHLSTTRDRQSVIVQAFYDSGLTQDVTDQVTWKLSGEPIVKQVKNVFTPLADGKATLTVSLGNLNVNLPVEVVDSKVTKPISFKTDVMPVFMKTNCNTGSCHGAARGKDGFRLSLFGFDPDGDYHRVTREIAGRRVNLALPEESLLLEKGVGTVPHTGGKRMEVGGEHYKDRKSVV